MTQSPAMARVTNHLLAVLLIVAVPGRGDAAPVDRKDPVPAYDNTGHGYLTAPSLSPGHILRPSSIFVMPTLGGRGTERLEFDFHWGNVWNYKPDQFMIDGEWIQSNLRFSHALTDSLSIGMALPLSGRTGGFADSTIEDFHRVFGLGNANRVLFPRNRSLITVRDGQDSHIVAEGEDWGIGDLSAFLASRLTEGSRLMPAVTVQAAVSFPSGNQDELRGLGTTGISLSSVASKRLGVSPVIAFMGMGFAYCDADDVEIIGVRDEQLSGLAGFEYQWSDSLGLLLQYLISSPVARNYYAFSEPSHEVSAGFKWRGRRDSLMELAVVENVAEFQNSADIGIHFAVSTAW